MSISDRLLLVQPKCFVFTMSKGDKNLKLINYLLKQKESTDLKTGGNS